MAIPKRGDVRRRMEQLVSNPDCQANVLSAVHGVSMSKVAESLGLEPKFGQSPFAISRGQQFEAGLFASSADRLLRELREQGGLPASGPVTFLDTRIKQNRGPCPTLADAEAAFGAALKGWAKGLTEPVLMASATLSLPSGTMLPDGAFAIDVLLAHPATKGGRIELEVGEIKVYPDRGGYTDPAQLASARAQAGLYVHVLDLYLRRLGLDHAFNVRSTGFLVLSKTGSNEPRVRPNEDFKYQARRAALALVQLGSLATQVKALAALPEPARASAVQAAPTCYRERCLSFCELAPHCHRKALADGDPAALGDDVARICGPISLPRAAELLNGRKPTNDVEADFVRRMDVSIPGRN